MKRFPPLDLSFRLIKSTPKAEVYAGVLSACPAYFFTLSCNRIGNPKSLHIADYYYNHSGCTHEISLKYTFRFKPDKPIVVFNFQIDLGSYHIKSTLTGEGKNRNTPISVSLRMMRLRSMFVIDSIAEYVRNAEKWEIVVLPKEKLKQKRNSKPIPYRGNTVDFEYLWKRRVDSAVIDSNTYAKKKL